MKLFHCLESTGDSFALVSAEDGSDGQAAEGQKKALVVDSETGHCVILKEDGRVAFLEAVYAPDEWWEALEAGAEVELQIGQGEAKRGICAGMYLFGDVNALGKSLPSRSSSSEEPAGVVCLDFGSDMSVESLELDVDDETRLVGYLLAPL